MKYMVTESVIRVVGVIWWPAVTCAKDYELDSHDIGNIEKPVTRDTVERWLMLHSGDFQSITDFEADLEIDGETVLIPWADEESECTYSDCMFPSEDE
jgi:hypothetical protein